jgi:selenocysteine-specific elongation factor
LRGFIIGTAGHIDHGKTALVRALTGIDTDRLKEEKERGISIELGFAEFRLPDGTTAGVVDVPGHEHFVKNMLAGATGFDLVLLVVAADDGVMPQTREHLAIIDLLGVEEGLVAVTKADLVDEEMVELVREEVMELLRGTGIEGAEIIATSAATGLGLDQLVQALMRAAARVRRRRDEGPFRLPIDRVFTLKGIGTVVTGTLWEGRVADGDEAVLLPEGRPVRVRNVQVHGREVEAAVAGQRVALNLPGYSVEDIDRGDVVASPGYLSSSFMLDARLRLLPGSPRPLKNRSRVRFHHGTREALGRVVLLPSREELLPGESSYAQFRLETPVVARYGDRFILRSYSPVTTIGGGIVLDAHPSKHRRADAVLLEALERRERGDVREILRMTLRSRGVPLSLERLLQLAETDREASGRAAEELLERGEWVKLLSEKQWKIVARETLEESAASVRALLEEFHRNNPREAGMDKETLRTRLFSRWAPGDFDGMLRLLAERGELETREGRVALPGMGRSLTPEEEKEKDALRRAIEEGGFSPPLFKELLELLGLDARKARDLLGMLTEEGLLEQVNQDYYLGRGRLAEAEEKIRAIIGEKGRLEVADLKGALGITRKYSIPLLEHMDRQKITRREGDYRVLS